MQFNISSEDAREVLGELIDAVIDFEMERDLETLLEKLLLHARLIVDAEAGSLYLIEDGETLNCVCQNDVIDGSTFRGEECKNSIALNHGSIASYSALNGEVVLVPDVCSIDPKLSYRFKPSLDQRSDFVTKSILAVPLRHPTEGVIGALELFNPDDGVFENWNVGILKHFAVLASVTLMNLKLHDTLEKSYLDTVFRLGLAAEFKDDDTYNHIQRTRFTSRIIARELGYSEQQQEILFHAAAMHDIGKIGVPDIILKKPGKLTDAERTVMRRHSEMGAKVFDGAESEILNASEEIAYCHHEKWNGTGYPNALKGEKIPPFARIVALADVFDALVQERCYKPAWKVSKALDLIQSERGEHFDPAVVDAFFARKDEIFKIQEKYGTLHY